MYTPSHYNEERTELIFEVVRRYSFSTVITQNKEGPLVSHLPLMLKDEGGDSVLIGHCARANPQWRDFSEGREVTAIFHGPHAYISPAWYKPQPNNVPTWNYVAVHVKGIATIIKNPMESYEVLKCMVQHFETEYGTNWKLPNQQNSDLEALVNAIVAFRIEIKNVQGKFKLSQKQSTGDRDNVIEQLPLFAGQEGTAIARYMERLNKS